MHGECFDRGMSGTCGSECGVFLDGKCDGDYAEIISNMEDGQDKNEMAELYEVEINPATGDLRKKKITYAYDIWKDDD